MGKKVKHILEGEAKAGSVPLTFCELVGVCLFCERPIHPDEVVYYNIEVYMEAEEDDPEFGLLRFDQNVAYESHVECFPYDRDRTTSSYVF